LEGKYVIDSRLYLNALLSSSTTSETRWTAASPTPGPWPILIWNPESSPAQNDNFGYVIKTYAVLANNDLEKAAEVEFASGLNPLPAGPCSLLAVVVADVVPDGPLDVEAILSRFRSSDRPPGVALKWMNNEWIRSEGMGGIWHTKLLELGSSGPQVGGGGFRGRQSSSLLSSNGPPEAYVGAPLVSNVVIADGQLTTIEVDVPADMLSRIQQLVENVNDLLC
jgi:hypothetical protein